MNDRDQRRYDRLTRVQTFLVVRWKVTRSLRPTE